MLAAILRDAPSAYGIATETWTVVDVRRLIERVFGVRYTPQHVGRLMRAALTSTEHLSPMLQVELEELLRANNVRVIRRRVERRNSMKRPGGREHND